MQHVYIEQIGVRLELLKKTSVQDTIALLVRELSSHSHFDHVQEVYVSLTNTQHAQLLK